MDSTQFDRLSKILAQRRQTRRGAIAGAAAAMTLGLVPGRSAAHEATPVLDTAEPVTNKTQFLFVQTFHSGAITPVEGVDDRFQISFNDGTGHTVYFADRPSREVGVAPTPEFLEGLGFSEDNPPNAALVVETPDGTTDVTVLELFAPVYDPETRGVTYDVEVLASWQDDLDLGLREDPAALASIASEFGAAHLFIDDCVNDNIVCIGPGGSGVVGGWAEVGYCWSWNKLACVPCDPAPDLFPSEIRDFWNRQCNLAYQACEGICVADIPFLKDTV